MICNRKHVSVGVAIFDTICGEDYCLFGYKLKHPTGWVGWELPGGKLDSGETVIEAAKREVFEETGLIIEPEFLNCFIETDNYVCLIFGAVPIDGEVELREPDKHREWSWFPCAEPPSPLIPYAADALEAISAASQSLKEEPLNEDNWWTR